MSPLLKKVENAGRKGIAKKRRPSKIGAEDFFNDGETVRTLFADIINCKEPLRVVSVASASYGIGNVVNNIAIKKGQNVVVAGDQFPSNVYPWMRLCKDAEAEIRIVEAPNTENDRAEKWNEKILKAIDKNTVAVATGHIHWADGTIFDLAKFREKTNEVGAALVIDGTQSVGALPFDIEELKPDAVICAAYKMLMGPYSMALAYYGPRFDDGKPLEENWMNRYKSEDFTNLVQYQEAYKEGALRYEVGEHSNFILVPMLIESLKQIRKWGPENVQEYCRKLVEKPIAELKGMGLYIEDEGKRANHLFGIKCPEDKLEQIKKQLKVQRVSVSFRGEFIRVAPHVYNDGVDMTKLMKAFRKVFQS